MKFFKITTLFISTLLFAVFSLSFFSVNAVKADQFTEELSFVYIFNLYYDNGQLIIDRESEFDYDLSAGNYVPEVLATENPHKGEIVSFSGQTISSFLFDPQKGDPSFTAGKVQVYAPYASNGQKAVFYSSEGEIALAVSVEQSSFCNEDGICDAERGKNHLNCPTDCSPPSVEDPNGGTEPVVPPAPEEPLFPTDDLISSNVTKILAIILGSIIIIGGIWFFSNRRRREQ